MGDGKVVGFFIVSLIIMLFYSFSITLVTYVFTDEGMIDPLTYTSDFSTGGINQFQTMSSDIEESLNRQTNIPVIDIGALVFYSGNLLIDMLLNFIYAIPQMIGFIFRGLELILNLPVQMFAIVEIFAFVVLNVLYLIGIIQLIAGIRSGRVIT